MNSFNRLNFTQRSPVDAAAHKASLRPHLDHKISIRPKVSTAAVKTEEATSTDTAKQKADAKGGGQGDKRRRNGAKRCANLCTAGV